MIQLLDWWVLELRGALTVTIGIFALFLPAVRSGALLRASFCLQ
jgi:hypothetical protein